METKETKAINCFAEAFSRADERTKGRLEGIAEGFVLCKEAMERETKEEKEEIA